MKPIGIYSFPKSGNTWLRIILANVMGVDKASIPDLHTQPFSDAVAFKGMRFFKLHAGKNIKRWQGQRLDTTHVIHIRRNPLDVFVSYLNYISDNVTGSAPIRFSSVDDIHGTPLFDMYFMTFVTMGHFAYGFAQNTRSYFEHNQYWTTQTEVPITLLRYEDMVHDTVAALAPVSKLIKIDDVEMATAVAKASQATKPDGKFFWKQRDRNFLSYLSDEQIDMFLHYRGEECRALGYPEQDFRRFA